jgi:DNA adenine methylase
MQNFFSPLRYPGGKSRVAKQLVDLFPSFTEYREPFVGGGSVFFQTKTFANPDKCWINDLNNDLYLFWVSVKNSVNELVNEVTFLKATHYGRGKELYYYLKPQSVTLSSIQTAVRFFILNRITYSGLTDSGGFSNESFEKRFTMSSINKLIEISHLLQGVEITNYDYSELLTMQGNDVFLFLDPPYYSPRNSKLYGVNGSLHTEFDHYRFVEAVHNCKHRWLITYDDDPLIRDLFKDYLIFDWNLQYGMSQSNGSAKIGKEIIITNYNPEPFLNKLF